MSFVLFCAYLCLLRVHHFFVGHIALVTDKKLVDTLSSISVDFLQPLLDVVEGILIGDIVDDNDTMCSSIVRRCDGAETLLAGRVPLK